MGVRVRQKKIGKGNPYWVFVSHNGKRTSRQVGSKKAAQDVADKIEAKLKLGEFGFNRKKIPTFGNYSKKWLKEYTKLNCRESTFNEYVIALKNHILPVFKNEKIDQIGRGDIRSFLLGKHSDGLSVSRVMMLKAVISGIFNHAIDEEIIETNPVSNISKRLFPKSDTTNRVGKDAVFTQGEMELFLNTCETDFPEYYPFFLTAARTGARIGELISLRWSDIDLINNYIWIRRNYRSGRFGRPKNGKSRKVDMSGQLAGVLSGMLKNNFKDVSELVFQKNGKIMKQHGVRYLYKKILKKGKVRYVKFHGIRHSYCAFLLSQGVSPYYVSTQVGHSSISVTCDVYGSWIRTEDNRYADLLDTHPNAPQAHPEGNSDIKNQVKSLG